MNKFVDRVEKARELRLEASRLIAECHKELESMSNMPIEETKLIYWECPEIKRFSLAIACGAKGSTGLGVTISQDPFDVGVNCGVCGDRLMAESRESLKEFRTKIQNYLPEFPEKVMCKDCARGRLKNSPLTSDRMKYQHEIDRESEEKRLIELKTMPYGEYLQSPEWKRTRVTALRRADNKCELCFSKNRLNVHHRTYRNLGSEHYKDLIVLCEDCHTKHHSTIRVDGGKTE